MRKLVPVLLAVVLMSLILFAKNGYASWHFDIVGNNTSSINLNFISDAGESFQTDAICLIVNYTGGGFNNGTNHLLPGMTDFGVFEASSGTVWATQSNLTGDSTLSGSYVPLATLNFDAPATAVWASDDISFAVKLDDVIWTGEDLAEGGHLTIDGEAPVNPIPTVSEWGMILMSLLLIVVGMMMIRRQMNGA